MLGISQNIQGSAQLLSDSIYKVDEDAHSWGTNNVLALPNHEGKEKHFRKQKLYFQRLSKGRAFSALWVFSRSSLVRLEWGEQKTILGCTQTRPQVLHFHIPSSIIASIVSKLKIHGRIWGICSPKSWGQDAANADPSSPTPKGASNRRAGISTTANSTRKIDNFNPQFCFA